MVESALISKLPNFNLSSAFYSLPDNIAQAWYCLETSYPSQFKVALIILSTADYSFGLL